MVHRKPFAHVTADVRCAAESVKHVAEDLKVVGSNFAVAFSQFSFFATFLFFSGEG